MIPNITINLTASNIYIENTTSFKEICEINQYKALESVANFPKIAFYTSLVAFTILFLYLVFSTFIKNNENRLILQDRIISSVTMLITTSLYFITLLTYPSQKTGSIMELIGITLIAIMVITIIIEKVKKCKTKQ